MKWVRMEGCRRDFVEALVRSGYLLHLVDYLCNRDNRCNRNTYNSFIATAILAPAREYQLQN